MKESLTNLLSSSEILDFENPESVCVTFIVKVYRNFEGEQLAALLASQQRLIRHTVELAVLPRASVPPE
jgi:hypothetical protein